MRLIDLSAPITPSPPDAPSFSRVEIEWTSHVEGAAQVQAMFHVPGALLRDAEGWAVEEFTRLGIQSRLLPAQDLRRQRRAGPRRRDPTLVSTDRSD